MKALSRRVDQLLSWRLFLFVGLVFGSFDAAMAESWFLGIPDPDNSRLIQFQTPVPQDFVTKVTKRQGPTAPNYRSRKDTINGKEYLILEQKIGWDPNNANGDAVTTFVTDTEIGGSDNNRWATFSGPEWQSFKLVLQQNSTDYGSGGWRQAELMVMEIPADIAKPVTLNMSAGSDAERWFLGVPDQLQPHLLHFRIPVPGDFVVKVMKEQGGQGTPGRLAHSAEELADFRCVVLAMTTRFSPQDAARSHYSRQIQALRKRRHLLEGLSPLQ